MEGKKVKMIISFIIVIGLAIGGVLLFKHNNTSSKTNSEEIKIENKIEEYVKENGKKYSKDLAYEENNFFVGGIGKPIKSYNIEKFKPEDFDIKGLIESVPENCDTFGSKVIIDDKEVVINMYTEKDKFYEKVED